VRPACLGANEFLPEPACESGDDLVLHVEQVGHRLVEALGPEVRSALRFDEPSTELCQR
jgi:hypothetical protein